MSINFNPLLWFVCRLCRQTFPDTDGLKKHKVQKHYNECETIRCIIFEERILNDQWIPADSIYLQEDSVGKEKGRFAQNIYCICNCTTLATLNGCNGDANFGNHTLNRDWNPPAANPKSCVDPNPNLNSNQILISSSNSSIASSTKPKPTKPKTSLILEPNPIVWVKRLTDEEINAAVFKNHVILNKEPESPVIRRASKRRIDCNEISFSPRKRSKQVRDKLQNISKIPLQIHSNCVSIPIDVININNAIDDMPDTPTIISELAVHEYLKLEIEGSVGDNADTDFDTHSNYSLQNPISPSPSVALNRDSNSNGKILDLKITGVDDSPELGEYTVDDLQHKPVQNTDIFDTAAVLNDKVTRLKHSDVSISLPIPESGIELLPNGTDDDIEQISIISPKEITDPLIMLTNEQETSRNNKTRTSRSRAKKINYSENHSCTHCHKDFYIVEDRDDHEKVCFLRNRKTFGKKYKKKLVTFSKKLNGKKVKIKPKQKFALENTPKFCENPQEQEEKDEDLNSEPSENCESRLSLIDYILLYHRTQKDPPQIPDSYQDLDFIQNPLLPENPSPHKPMNVIHLDPDPTLDPENFFVSNESPVTCKLCRTKLVTESELRNHVENCWFYNKGRHIFCVLCNREWKSSKSLAKHNKTKHPRVLNLTDEMQVSSLPLKQWLEVQRKKPNAVILLDPEPTANLAESPSFPIKCKLCQHQLTSELHLRNHVQICWQSKKHHCYCLFCDKSFPSNRIYCAHTCKMRLNSKNRSPYSSWSERRIMNKGTLKYRERSFRTFQATCKNKEWDEKKGNEPETKTNFLAKTGIRENPSVEDQPQEKTHDKRGQTMSDLFYWLNRERQLHNLDGSNNVILIDPEPQQGDTQEVSEAYPIKCLLCSWKYVSVIAVQQHAGSCWVRNKAKHVYCVPCKKSFYLTKHLHEHNIKEHPEKPNEEPTASFRCNTCIRNFPNEKFYMIHMELHKDPNFKPFQCPYCPKTFRERKTLLKHLIVHGAVTKNNCRYCDKSFANKNGLEDHERSHVGYRPFKCPVPNCSKSFTSKPALYLHTKINHFAELGLEQFLCPICGKVFGLQSILDKHYLFNHSSEKPFKCTEQGCIKAFKRRDQLRQHAREHTGETPYQCDECGRAFSQKWTFTKHQRSHQGTLNQAACHLCPRKFLGNWELKQHLKKVHDGELVNGTMGANSTFESGLKSKSQFKCQFCGVQCATKTYLKKHEKTHEAEDESDEPESESNDSVSHD